MSDALHTALARLDTLILGKPTQIRLALTCLLARGHLLIEDVPGVGKTTLALALARVLGLEFARVQFTSDLLPADILGASVYHAREARFDFHPGPIFTQLMLADEINRASPKTQSALLEAMEERQVSIEGQTRALPEPFFVVATQNPQQQIGTFALPESQLDRFLMRISLGYPSPEAERALLLEQDRRSLLRDVTPALTLTELQALQQQVQQVRTTAPLIDYLLALIEHSRTHPRLRQGLSPRAGLALRRAAQAWALLHGRSGVIPEDVQAVFASVAGHRLVAQTHDQGHVLQAQALLAEVAIP
ncbi:MoxR family ATPase [Sinimarinibacterium sp. NLF-5-8]|uniref:AAA family ATPase n=1 Tax=Sinimarinibacterium sp. NLF-5-8 TaxID=2698684 RepID=UPI00137BA46C|nr:AAA family ATPase [Sinimarinibacterium sp. NLF-5-8]QHS09753.1 AAA domain-containing protein [Sinimarinibacterium sp. NLF-5-8]